MDFKTNEVSSSVNVTVHKNHLKKDAAASYAKVKRNKAGLGAVVQEALKNSSTLKLDGMMAAALLLKQAILALLQLGHAVDVLNLGTFYLTASGNIESDNPDVTAIPDISLGFTPSEEALRAVSGVVVDTATREETEPVIEQVEDRFTYKTGDTLTAGKTAMIHGRNLRIAGNENEVGVFFALETDGNYDTSGNGWIQVKESELGTNLPKTLDFNLPAGLQSGKKYRLIIKTASSARGKRINKTVRTIVYDKVITVA